MSSILVKRYPLKFREYNTSKLLFKGVQKETTNSGLVTVIGQDGTPCIDYKGRLRYNRFIVQFADGTIISVDRSALNRGDVENPNRKTVYNRGSLGIGNYEAYVNHKPSKEYVVWISMFTRCYNPDTWINHPQYKECEVDERWWNFQNFCEELKLIEGFSDWVIHGSKQFHLDKDILVKGNKLYTLSRCKFVTVLENSREATTNKIVYKAYKWGKFVEEFTAQRDFARKHRLSEASLSRWIANICPSKSGWVIIRKE